MGSKYDDDDEYDFDDDDYAEIGKRVKTKKSNPDRIKGRLERWRSGKEEVYYYDDEDERIGTRDLCKILTPAEIQLLRQKAKKGITVKHNTPTARGIHTTKRATISRLMTRKGV